MRKAIKREKRNQNRPAEQRGAARRAAPPAAHGRQLAQVSRARPRPARQERAPQGGPAEEAAPLPRSAGRVRPEKPPPLHRPRRRRPPCRLPRAAELPPSSRQAAPGPAGRGKRGGCAGLARPCGSGGGGRRGGRSAVHRRAPPAPSRRRQRHVSGGSRAGGHRSARVRPGRGWDGGGGATCGPRGFAALRLRARSGAGRLAGSQPASRGASVCVPSGCAEGLGSRRPLGLSRTGEPGCGELPRSLCAACRPVFVCGSSARTAAARQTAAASF